MDRVSLLILIEGSHDLVCSHSLPTLSPQKKQAEGGGAAQETSETTDDAFMAGRHAADVRRW